jgi:hypothetical protein
MPESCESCREGEFIHRGAEDAEIRREGQDSSADLRTLRDSVVKD